MDALALYRLTSVPEQKKVSDRPVKRRKGPSIQTKANVEYICFSCKEPVLLTADENVQCTSCDCRMVRKKPVNTKRTYQAI